MVWHQPTHCINVHLLRLAVRAVTSKFAVQRNMSNILAVLAVTVRPHQKRLARLARCSPHRREASAVTANICEDRSSQLAK